MPAPRPMSQLPIGLPALALITPPSSTAAPVGLSLDRKVVFGAGGTGTRVLYRSTDDGATWTSTATFENTVVGCLELDDGEAIVTVNAAAAAGILMKSTGWATNPATATWRQVLRTSAGYVEPYWSMHWASFGDDRVRPGSSAVGITNEYGGQTTASGDQSGKATRVYVTTDAGATWAVALDLLARYPGRFPLHVHATCYDPWWDRFWLTYGDTNAEGPQHLGALYSDDRGATWQPVETSPEWAGQDYLQSTPIAPLPTHMLMGGDNLPGFMRIPRAGYRKTGPVQVSASVVHGTGGQMIANAIFRNRRQDRSPVLSTWQCQADNAGPGGILVSLDDGATYTQAYADPMVPGNTRQMDPGRIFGPTYNGVVLGRTRGHGEQRWELLAPVRGAVDNTATLTADGTTTTFTVPHRLPRAPLSHQAWPTTPGMPAFTTTTDATNLTVTFATAPATGARLAIGYRVLP